MKENNHSNADLKIIGQGMTNKDPSIDQLCHFLLSSPKILCYKFYHHVEMYYFISIRIIILIIEIVRKNPDPQ